MKKVIVIIPAKKSEKFSSALIVEGVEHSYNYMEDDTEHKFKIKIYSDDQLLKVNKLISKYKK